MPAGRLWLDESGADVHGLDVALLPECRGLGIGTMLVGELLAEGARSARPVRFAVEIGNARAQALWLRLGFAVVDDIGSHLLMERRP